MTDKEIDNRFMAMEMKLAYMEDFVNQIQEVAVQQAKDIELLKTENKILSQRLKDVMENAGADIPNRKPPHY